MLMVVGDGYGQFVGGEGIREGGGSNCCVCCLECCVVCGWFKALCYAVISV